MYLFLGYCVFFVTLVPISLLTFWVPYRYRIVLISPFWQLFGRILLAMAGCKLTEQDRRSPKYKKLPLQGLYISNHQSFVDIPILSTQFQIAPIMKREVLFIPFFGLVALISGSIVVNRRDKNSRRKAFEKTTQRMLKKNAVQYYPEGTRSKTGEPKDFSQIKTSLMECAYQKGVAVIPVSVFNSSNILSNEGSVNRGTNVGIIVHSEIHPKDYDSEEIFMRSCWEQVLKGHQELKEGIDPV